MKATLQLVPLIFISFILLTCATKDESRLSVQSMRSDPADTMMYLSDPGVTVTVMRKSLRSLAGGAVVYDGHGNAVGGKVYPAEETTTDSTDVFVYNFKTSDLSGTWTIALTFEGENPTNLRFVVAPAQVVAARPSNVYQLGPCTSDDGGIILASFYQITAYENESIRQYGVSWSWTSVIEAVKYRSILCGGREITGESYGDWEKYLEALSGKKIRQQQPSVHERIEAVMPVYEEEFLFVNPAFVKWFAETMIPDPGASAMFDWTFQGLYDVAVRDIARRMALTYMYYNSLPNGGLDAQVQFAEMAARKYVNKEEQRVMERNDYPDQYTPMMEWHEEPAKTWVASQLPSSALGENGYFLVPNELGFWLRRGIDGSANEVWKAMREVMFKYDEYWVKNYVDGEWKM